MSIISYSEAKSKVLKRTDPEIRKLAPPSTKWCAHHQAYCQVSDFGLDRRQSSGLQSSCRRGQQQKLGPTTKVSKYNPAPHGTKWCGYHKQFEPLEWFSSRSLTKKDQSGKSARCREGERAYQLPRAIEWQKKNPEKACIRNSNRRARIRAAEGSCTKADIDRIFKAQKGKCAYCRTSLADGFDMDHIVPIAKGGTNWPANVQLCCKTCNLRKNARDPIDFAQSLGRLL